MNGCRLFLVIATIGLSGVTQASVTIADVHADRTHISRARSESVMIAFKISEPATMTLHIFDGRDIEIRHIDSGGDVGTGEHTLVWDAKDWHGLPVPAEAYTYSLSAATQDGQRTVFDLTDMTGGEAVTPQEVKWDAALGLISYVLTKPARVNIRLGLQNSGPLLRTVIDWVPRMAGLQHETWDGFDASHVLSLALHPSLSIGVNAFSLPENTIFVGEPASRIAVIEKLPDPVVHRVATLQLKQMHDHAQQPLEGRGDYSILFQLPEDLKSREGLPLIERPTPLTINAGPQDRPRIVSRRFEPVYFVDGQYLFENEVGYMPMTWVWDPSTTSEGVHYLTVNLRGYEGNFGMATRKVYVRHPTTPVRSAHD